MNPFKRKPKQPDETFMDENLKEVLGIYINDYGVEEEEHEASDEVEETATDGQAFETGNTLGTPPPPAPATEPVMLFEALGLTSGEPAASNHSADPEPDTTEAPEQWAPAAGQNLSPKFPDPTPGPSVFDPELSGPPAVEEPDLPASPLVFEPTKPDDLDGRVTHLPDGPVVFEPVSKPGAPADIAPDFTPFTPTPEPQIIEPAPVASAADLNLLLTQAETPAAVETVLPATDVVPKQPTQLAAHPDLLNAIIELRELKARLESLATEARDEADAMVSSEGGDMQPTLAGPAVTPEPQNPSPADQNPAYAFGDFEEDDAFAEFMKGVDDDRGFNF